MPRKNRLFAKLASTVNSNGKLQESSLAAGIELGGGGITEYASTLEMPTTGIETGKLAYATSTNKLYMWNGNAWFNIAIVNQAPTGITGGLSFYNLATDGTPTVITLVSTDPEGFPLTWSSSVSGDTQIGTVTQVDNVFTITPSTDKANAGTLSVTFSVTDGTNTETATSVLSLSFSLEGDVAFNDALMSDISSSNADQTIPGDAGATISLTASINETEFTSFPFVAAAGSIGGFPASMGNHRFFDENTNGHTKGFVVSMNPFAVSSGNGSMEFFIRYNNSHTKRQHVCADKYALQASTSYGLTWLRDGLTNASIYVAGISGTQRKISTLTVGTWYHCYFAKVGSNFYFYKNGSLESSWSSIPDNWSYVVDEYVFMNSGVNNSEDDGAAVSMAGIRMLKGDLIYATSGGSRINGVEEPI